MGWFRSRNSSVVRWACLGLVALRVDDHALGRLGVAGDLELGHLLDLDQAHAAVAVDGEIGVVAEVRDLDADLGRGLDDGRALRDFHRLAVEGEAHVPGLGGRAGRSGRFRGRFRRGRGRALLARLDVLLAGRTTTRRHRILLFVAHRSSSPAMTLSPPMIAIASASWPPLIIAGTPGRCCSRAAGPSPATGTSCRRSRCSTPARRWRLPCSRRPRPPAAGCPRRPA